MNTLPVLVLAGGLGTRLKEKTKDTPKALVQIAGKPFLYWKLRELEDQGVHEVHLLIGHFADEIEKFVETFTTSLQIFLHRDGEQQLGTAGAIFRALSEISARQFVVTYGDNLLQLPIATFTNVLREASLLVVTQKIHNQDEPNTNVVNGFIETYTKAPNSFKHMDYGYVIFSKKHFLDFESNKNGDLANYFQALAKQGKFQAFETDEDYFEIGTPESFAKVEDWLFRRDQE